MGVGHQQTINKVFFFNTRRRFAFTATTLCFVVGKRLVFHVALMRQRHHNIFFVDQIFDIDVGGVRRDLSTTLVTELLAD